MWKIVAINSYSFSLFWSLQISQNLRKIFRNILLSQNWDKSVVQIEDFMIGKENLEAKRMLILGVMKFVSPFPPSCNLTRVLTDPC